ncbi:nuclear transport factor 2 family protein [Streptomyces similanensis]|uniref:NTF2 domain-containing protein n=1 Tax=Streptomyces similanensis TaxID=1274988 RepID=A0ABP9KN65_9ACTN
MSADVDNIAKQFADHFYSTFDTASVGLEPLYREASMLTWDGSPSLGSVEIMKVLPAAFKGGVTHQVDAIDAQPASQNAAAILVQVTGSFTNAGTARKFTEAFQLLPDGSSYYIHNHIRRTAEAS